ncbi:hypothetical protein AnaeK_3076 [Anaeromyxobacter sp. K]|uniref:hypothetical protein n=1 Tax=Anaeromyxobacter sp. (strain K) TaxID=447217 RepID=UPI00015F8993|nr:hypothetical protein [Anaeromyxobacter sp. K]ACG74297.1 hypothetical protein AnaeK_3076 [Anaeromyxobacter sp. K]
MFKVTRLSDYGAGTPAVARLGPGVHDLVKFSRLSEENRDKVCSCAWDVMQVLVPAQRLAHEVIQEFDEIEAGIQREGISVQSGAIEVPSALKLDKVSDFIVRAKKVLARAMELVELFWGKRFDAAHYHKVLEWARADLGPDAPLTRLLEDDQKWIKHIIDLRNEEEHPSRKGPFVRNYDVDVSPKGGEVSRPRFFDGTDVRSALTVFSENLLTFVEELIALGVMHTFTFPQLAIAEISVKDRDPTLPVRFRVVLNDEAHRRFVAGTKAQETTESRLPETPPPRDAGKPKG